jgi:uncharacterized protein YjdB
MRHRHYLLGTSAALAFLTLLAERAPAQNVTELYVTPDTIRLQSGQRQGLTVQAFDDAGNVSLAIRYRVGDSSIARVEQNGTVSAARAGRTEIVVQAGKKSKTIPVLVRDTSAEPLFVVRSGARTSLPITQLIAEPASLSLLPTERGRVTLKAYLADGTPAPVGRVQWRSLQTAVAMVEDSTGTITGLSTGVAVIQALIPGGPILNLPVTVALAGFGLDHDKIVLSLGDSDTLAAIVPSQGGRRLRSGDLQWSTSDDAVADVTADGIISTHAAGRTELIVHGYLQELRLPVIVHQRVARFAAAPRLNEPVRLPVLASREFTLIPLTADSLPIDGVPITWTLGDSAIAEFDEVTGQLTARRSGTTTLQFAARGFVSKGWTIEVIPGTVAFNQSRLALRPGERTQLTAQFLDANATPVGPAAGLSWITSNANVARVKPDGTIEAVSPGRAVISAQAKAGQPAQATVFVTGDLLVASSRHGRFGVYALLGNQPESFFPLIADSSSNNIDPSYSPDRTRIVFSSDRLGVGNYDIFIADADGREPVRITSEPAMEVQPVWTPDGNRLVFVSARGGVRQLYVMRVDGSEVRQLTALPGGAEAPALSPDGRVVAFKGYPLDRAGQSDIFQVPIDGGAPVSVSNTRDRSESSPAYMSDGQLTWVLPRRDKREPDQVLRQAAPGSIPSPIVSSELTIVDVAFSRDGSRVAWIASRPGERNGNGLEFTFQWRALPSGAEVSVRLLPGERITSPAF